MLDARRPGSGGDDDVLSLYLACGRFHSGRASEDGVDALHTRCNDYRATALCIGEQRAGEQGRVYRTVFGREQRAETRRRRGKALGDVTGLEPIATQSGLSLVGDSIAQALRLRFVECQGRDPFTPQPDVDPGGFQQRGRQTLIEVTPPQAQRSERLVCPFDLWAEDPG